MAENDLAVLERDLEKLLVEWRTWIGGRNRQARQILTKLLVGRLTFTPKIEAGSVFYEFTGTGALEPILDGVLPHEPGQDLTVRRGGAPGVIRPLHTG